MAGAEAGRRVLLVDDGAILRRTFARALTGRGYAVTEAGSHAEAIAALGWSDTLFDLLVLDINLPDATGWDVLRDLRAAGRDLPVIVMTGVMPRTERLREFRPDGVLQKPFPIDALYRLAERCLGTDGGADDD
jgi:CheY-like chemotaxis protein